MLGFINKLCCIVRYHDPYLLKFVYKSYYVTYFFIASRIYYNNCLQIVLLISLLRGMLTNSCSQISFNSRKLWLTLISLLLTKDALVFVTERATTDILIILKNFPKEESKKQKMNILYFGIRRVRKTLNQIECLYGSVREKRIAVDINRYFN